MSDWRDDLRPASWRGIPFGVFTHDTRAGRRTALHEYPFRDTAWVEDLGLAVRRLSLQGFVVGDDVVTQVEALRDAAEEEGPGELVHPIFGSCEVSLVDFGAEMRVELGRVASLAFIFIQGGERIYPTLGTDFAGDVLEACGLADLAASSDFAKDALGAVQQGAQVVQQVQSTARAYISQVQRFAGDVRSVVGSVGGLVPGLDRSFGRLIGGSRSPLGTLTSITGSVSQGLARVSQARAAVTRAGATVERLAGLL
ncbi:DNA circularization N-terminal domain-containing protein [Roseomonas indoligenes]|uniref:DNA circularization N-terminal domain-containing protein n=1 Tax=Roseomonas indoligenes TaxID=2820811 RepID=A0A940S4N5_9PROT|nr:DNA circularization N-terminal domain-containing protein [Pararoseomonas indoligenes]MBP0492164.1 DNA circularization N-terminal domain-containing protein [Pararoseomonas indoligenes]